MLRVAGYIRVSSEDQAREGVSLDAQREKIRHYAAALDLDVVETIADPGFSAKNLDRPGIARALAMLDSGEVAGLIVFKLDRLTRNLSDWSGLIERYFGEKGGRSLMSVSESIDTRTAAGRLVLNVLMAAAQWERETIVERTRTAVRFKQSRRERVGQLPYGRKLDADGRTLIPEPAEIALAAEARAYQASGRSLRWIAETFRERGVEPKNPGGWTFSRVRSLIRSPTPVSEDRS